MINDAKINNINDFNDWNKRLKHYNLFAYQHRIIIRLSTYIHKLFNNLDSPANLFNFFVFNRELNKNYDLRNLHKLNIPSKGKFNEFKQKTFDYFFSMLINELHINELHLNLNLFKSQLINNIDSLFLKFVQTFEKYDIKFKHKYLTN